MAATHTQEMKVPFGVDGFVVNPHIRANHMHVSMRLDLVGWRVHQGDKLGLIRWLVLWHLFSMARRDSVSA